MTRQRRRRIIKLRRTGVGLALVAAISFLAGMTDAIGLLLSGDFVSFMSGNTTRAAIAVGTGDLRHALILLGALLAFIIGNALGVIVAHTAVMLKTFKVLCGVALLLGLASVLAEENLSLVRFYLMVLSMGLVNAAVEHVEGLPIGLTYVTGALSRFGRGLGRWIIGHRQVEWTVQIVPWVGMLAGAVTGALLQRHIHDLAIWVPCLLALLLAFASLLIPRPWQSRFTQGAPKTRAAALRGK